MIGQIRGKILSLTGSCVLIDVQGVGYELFCSRYCLSQLEQGTEATLVVYTEVREDLIRLHGFSDTLEKQVFLMLLKVNGVGARTASEVISQIDKRELLRAIGSGDVTRLQALKGIGKKTAERIVVELRDSVGEFASDRQPLASQIERLEGGPVEDAIEALVMLGFSRKDGERAVRSVTNGEVTRPLDSGNLVKEALKFV
jgi:holliday junction DNA helicase RuvA